MGPLSAQAGVGSAQVQRAAPGSWAIVPHSNGNLGITFTLGWSLGTHEGQASRVTGAVQAQAEPFMIGQGEFRIPITAMSTGSVTRDCHMREALGINYSGSRFPADHVCVNDQVPASGPDSVVYPDIIVRIRGLQPNQPGAAALASGLPPLQQVEVAVLMEMSIHGITKEFVTPVRLQLIARDQLQAEADVDVKLADFGVVVKMPPLLRVDDIAKLTLRLLLRSQATTT
jgi:polyisoprenoid-binding protein YceI